MELEPRYVDVSVLRWQAFTGLSATLLSDGRMFEQVAADRHGGNKLAISPSTRGSRLAETSADE